RPGERRLSAHRHRALTSSWAGERWPTGETLGRVAPAAPCEATNQPKEPTKRSPGRAGEDHARAGAAPPEAPLRREERVLRSPIWAFCRRSRGPRLIRG